MPWPSASLRFAVLFLAATVGPPGALGGENVGKYTLSFKFNAVGWEPKLFQVEETKFCQCSGHSENSDIGIKSWKY